MAAEAVSMGVVAAGFTAVADFTVAVDLAVVVDSAAAVVDSAGAQVDSVVEPAFAEATSVADLAEVSTEVLAEDSTAAGAGEVGASDGAWAGDGRIIGIGPDTIPTAMGTLRPTMLLTMIPTTARTIRLPLTPIQTTGT